MKQTLRPSQVAQSSQDKLLKTLRAAKGRGDVGVVVGEDEDAGREGDRPQQLLSPPLWTSRPRLNRNTTTAVGV